ncbi:vitamin K epoxide reductase family protein [Alkalicoccus luteus]|uniref:Vitamin K epoxide reductase family protein n=1 Tax=Alkalicoccus luteus TaxID=1237094 RepID=A0A969TTQ5_9BACI|nr:vitamin K epoxide reductase family protein [Alkalicoccus luteus]NJP36171.1 vitamin K epoxide reductase family protein [Alkalicoccus luteus]
MSEMVQEQIWMNKKNSDSVSADAGYAYGKAVPNLFALFTAVAAIGWAVSVFLTGIHFWVLPLPAGFDVTGTPWAVMTSEWAYVMGIPLAMLGAFYYLTVLLFAGLWYHTKHPLVLKVLTPITIAGVFSSAFFVYLQLFVIEAICPFCMVSAAATTILLGLELLMLKMSKLPSIGAMFKDVKLVFHRQTLTWMLIMFVSSSVVILSFWLATVVPAPGT